MIRFTRLAAASDGSEHGCSAVLTGAACARRAGASFEVFSVVESFLLPFGVEFAQHQGAFGEELRKQIDGQLAQAEWPDAPVHTRTGLAAPLITELADELEPDLLVVGAHPRPAVARYLVGSTAERIIRLSRRPVLVATQGRGQPYQRILAAVDLSRHSRPILEITAALAQMDGAHVRALYVEDRLTPMLLEAALFDEKQTRHAARVQFREMLSRMSLPSELTMDREIREGHAGHEILNEARDWAADLIVMGSHGFGFFNRLLLGSTSTYVLRHGHCDTLVVPRVRDEE